MKVLDGETYVYCTDCIRGKRLLKAIEETIVIPFGCKSCYPYDPEDSRPYYVRLNYVEKEP